MEQIFEVGKRPNDIPAVPARVYESEGWNGWGDWLGTGNLLIKEFRSFEDAKLFVCGLGLKNSKEWYEYAKSGKMPEDIPRTPYYAYKDEGWKGMGDWLGTGQVANQFKEYRAFEDAREFALGLGLEGQKEWR